MSVYIGDKFYNPDTREYFTVIEIKDGTRHPIAFLQYDSGMPATEPLGALEERFQKVGAEYVNTEQQPVLGNTCGGDHQFDDFTNASVPVCTDCHLSAAVLGELLGEDISTAGYCAYCGSRIEASLSRSDYASCSIVCDECWGAYQST